MIEQHTLASTGVNMPSQVDDLDRILLTESRIAEKVAELGARIAEDYRGRDLTLISILKGGIIFLADLSRRIPMPHQFELVGAQSYKDGAVPSGDVRITKDIDLEIHGRDVLIIEDIYDTGATLRTIREMILLYNPRSLEICSLLVKDKPRDKELDIKYTGFEIEDVFVVGYGLDYREKYRNLSCIGVLAPEIYR